MNNPRWSYFSRLHFTRLGPITLTLTLSAFLTGCGDSESSESAVVEPPTPQSTEDTTTSSFDAPGDLVLPAGEIPDSNEKPAGVGEGGFEMPTDTKASDSSSGQSSPQPDVKYASWEAIEKDIKASGKVTVVDLWSLACEPCLKEFPGLVELHRDHGDKVYCVAVDLDYDGRKTRPPNYYEEKILAFLKGVEAGGLTTYVSETPSDDVYAATELISIPAVLVFDAKGELVKSFVDAGPDAGFTYHGDVTPFVQSLVSN